MKVTQVSIQPTEAARQAGRPALTPELLAASGARYSRSNEGLEAILSRIDPANLDRSVDGIFRMIDYGHQSIADMVPAAMFIDGISLWLAYYTWTLCPTAGGQESSTRYIRLGTDNVIPSDDLGLPADAQGEWDQFISDSLASYQESLSVWDAVAERDPGAARIPRTLLEDTTEKAGRQVARMRRNYSFDRARYFLPAAVSTNIMLIMSARAWVQVCQQLLSHPLPEAQRLGGAIRDELVLSAPRMLKHASEKESFRRGIRAEMDALSAEARAAVPPFLQPGAPSTECPSQPELELLPPVGMTPSDFATDLQFHDNRYAWTGSWLKRTLVRFRWEAMTFAEIRDLNRHRTGTRYCPLRPQGFYGALDELPTKNVADRSRLSGLCEHGRAASARAHALLAEGDPAYCYWTLLGTQYPFEHNTTADKFLYEAELRTGTGAHYRYARHLHEMLEIWFSAYPDTRGLVLEGSAEPE